MSNGHGPDSHDSGPPIRAYLTALTPPPNADQDARYQRGRALIERLARTPQMRLWQVKLTPAECGDIAYFRQVSKPKDSADPAAVVGLQFVIAVLDENMRGEPQH